MNRLVILTAMLVLCAWGVAEAKEALVPEEHQQIVTVNRLRRADEASLHFRQRRSIDDVTRDSEEEEEEFRHPVYNITAFGRQMIIVLERDEKLVSPALTVSYTSSAPNVSCNITNPKRFPVKNCFYKGYVLDEEESSSVAMSISTPSSAPSAPRASTTSSSRSSRIGGVPAVPSPSSISSSDATRPTSGRTRRRTSAATRTTQAPLTPSDKWTRNSKKCL